MTNNELLEMAIKARCQLARDDFSIFRKTINPNLKWGWFNQEVSNALSQFYSDMLDKKRPMTIIQAPPQHGKSVTAVDFISWIAGKHPDYRTIYTSFSERLGIRANLRIQRIMDSEQYKNIFPETFLQPNEKTKQKYIRNREIIEYFGHEGYFRNTTVGGSITGESLDIGIIDDPIRGRKDANSITKRNSTWDWFTDDFFTRFSENAGMLCILTRWHIDDVIGRLIEKFPEAKVLKYSAQADEDEAHRKKGEPLFPELKSLEFLMERKAAMDSASWQSLYQQSPIVLGGEIIKGSFFKYYRVLPRLAYRVIYADTAQKTKEANDYSVFQCWGKSLDGTIYLIDQIRGKWEAPDLLKNAYAFWNKHKNFSMDKYEKPDATKYGALRAFKVEDKSSGTGLIQELASKYKIPVYGIQRVKDKYTRVYDIIAYIEAGYVFLDELAHYLSDFISECEAFTADDSHPHDDQIDPMTDAANDMLAQKDPWWKELTT